MTNWPRVELAEIAQIVMGQSPPGETYNHDGDGLPFFQGKGDFGDNHPTTRTWCSKPTRIAESGDVLLSVRAPVGPTNTARETCCIGRGLAAIRVNRALVHQDYLRFFFKHNEAFLTLQGQGSTFGAIKRSEVESIEIPIPPLSEQRRIVEILDQADRLRRRRSEADAKSERVLPSLFIKMFGDPAVNPMRWPCRSLSDLAIRFSDGPFGSNLKTSHYRTDGVRVLRLQNVGVGKLLDDDKAFVSPDHFASLLKHKCLPGDVIVATLGDPNLRAFVVPSHIPRALNKADCVQIRPKPGRAFAEYICWLLNAPGTVRMAERLMHGQTRTRISMGLLKSLSVPVPEYGVQERFASHVRVATRVIAMGEQVDENVMTLWNVLRHAAFTRRLTASWRKTHMTELLQEMEQQMQMLAREAT